MERRRIILALVVALLLMPSAYAATLCSYKGPDTSEHYLQLTDFLVSGDSPLTVGDKVTASFKLTYVGKEPVTFDDKYGVFVAAKDPDGKTKMFGNTHQGKTLKSGKSVTVETDITLDNEGEWVLWASYCIKGKKETICGPEEWDACKIKVEAKPICPEGCECLTEARAKELGYVYCGGEKIICGYDQYQNPMYCYEKPVVTPTPTPTATLSPTPEITPTPTPKRPDLIIEEIKCDYENSRIGYVIKNVGGATAPSGHATTLYIDGKEVTHDSVSVDLKPGATYESWFKEYKWPECKTAKVKVCADNYDQVKESNEQNNCRERVCECIVDVTAPRIISGPAISQVTQTSALICWETDEASDSIVRYDSHAGKYELVVEDSALVKKHCFTLPKLEPATTYHFVVESKDSSGNKVSTQDLSFETLSPPDKAKPTVSLRLPDKLSGRVPITADAQDNIGVDRVVFFLDGKPVYTDYAPPFEWDLDTRGLDDGAHILTIQAFDTAGNMAVVARDAIVQNRFLPDESPVLVTIENPEPHSGVYGWIDIEATITHEYYSCIQHAEIEISSTRSEREVVYSRDYLCRLPWRRPGPPPPSPPRTVRYAYDIRELEPGTEVVIEVRGRDEFGNEGHANVLVTVVEPPPVELPLDIHRSVTRHGNYFHVELTLRNTGTEAVHDFTVIDKSKGFQGVRNPDLVISYDCDTKQTSAKQTVMHFGPGDTCTLSYDLVPVLFHPLLHNYDYCIGESRLDVSYEDYFGREYSREYFSPWWCSGPEINDAFESADYLIVTNPHHLFDQNAVGDVNMLLSTMADLAKEKNGVLGYLPYDATSSTLKALIRDGSNQGIWNEKLAGPWNYFLGCTVFPFDYLLLVGETEIVPSYDYPAPYNVRISDYFYADISGDDRPELKVGRIIGENATELMRPIQASIDVCKGVADYDGSHALMISGPEDTWERFVWAIEQGKEKLRRKGVSVRVVHTDFFDTVDAMLRCALRTLGSQGQRPYEGWDEWRTDPTLPDDTLPDGSYKYDASRGAPFSADLTSYSAKQLAAWMLWARYELSDREKEQALSDAGYADSLITNGRLDRALDLAEDIMTVRVGRGGSNYGWSYTYVYNHTEVLAHRRYRIRNNAFNKDIIIFDGHGGPGSWANVLDSWDSPCTIEGITFHDTRPIVIAFSCLTGNYEADARSIARAFFKHGAAVYFGSTEVANSGLATNMVKDTFWGFWSKESRIGDTIFNLKGWMIENGWRRDAYEYNLYGDPKFGGGE